MEVQAHTHTPRKKWTHYFWEFFMLFLAVTAGFLVENFRHHSLEKKIERQYMYSLVEDLRTDTSQLNYLKSLFNTIRIKEDSLLHALQDHDIVNQPGKAYPYLGYPLDGYAFHRSERTIQQLKNAGGLRLIHSHEASNRIADYDETYRKSAEINMVQIETYYKYRDIMNQVADAALIGYPYRPVTLTDSIKYKWITTDPKDFKLLYNITRNIQWLSEGYVVFLEQLFDQATSLIIFLRKEYGLGEKR